MKEAAAVTLSNEEVFMATQFKDFVKTIVVISRGGGGKKAQGENIDFRSGNGPEICSKEGLTYNGSVLTVLKLFFYNGEF